MASLTATDPTKCSGSAAAAESIVPACMFAPDRGCVEDPTGEDALEGSGAANGESPDHLDLSSKLALVSPTGEQYDSLLQNLRERIDEGCGETIYVVGMGSDTAVPKH